MRRKTYLSAARSFLLACAMGGACSLAAGTNATAADEDSFIGEISCTAATYCPVYWVECNGQLLNIQAYQALYALLGNKFGGTYPSTFAVPDLRSRTVIGSGAGTGLTSRASGTTGGVESVTLTESQMPAHNHALNANTGSELSASPVGKISGAAPAGSAIYTSASNLNTTMGTSALGSGGGGQAHENRQPYLAVKCCIATSGLYPPRQ